MAYGDVGGAITELVITCVTKPRGSVHISKGDAVVLTGAYQVCNNAWGTIFGQALSDADLNDEAIPIKVRGVSVFRREGFLPELGKQIMTCAAGSVQGADDRRYLEHTGCVLKVTDEEVHVLL